MKKLLLSTTILAVYCTMLSAQTPPKPATTETPKPAAAQPAPPKKGKQREKTAEAPVYDGCVTGGRSGCGP